MWGTQLAEQGVPLHVRITPTCVGNTKKFYLLEKSFEDHPHLCGEHYISRKTMTQKIGSPPPVWGTRHELLSITPAARITPTCVGNTRPCCANPPRKQDHPHLCGEHIRSTTLLLTMAGSPPPVWGTPIRTTASPDYTRITPTCVGNTKKNRLCLHNPQDHPHLCGEHCGER